MNAIKNKIRKLLDDLPFVNTDKRHHPVEYNLIQGKKLAKNTHPSILHFSLNKAATQYTKRVLTEVAAAHDLVNVHYNGYAFHSDFPYLDQLSAVEIQRYQYLFQPKGYCYSVFGGMIESIPDLPDYLVVWMIRDPRDILVSSYFSMANSHPRPNKRSNKLDDFDEKRQFAQQHTVDEYVKSESDDLLSVYGRYIDLLLTRHPSCYITKYEDMVSNHEGWLMNMMNYCQLEISEVLKNQLLQQHQQMRPKGENQQSHMRRGVAGDFREKLESNTIDFLNDQFADVLNRFEYA
ncbi:MAG: sulfotransferase domain-containing protein [Bacteroidota bacterium]